VPSPERLIVALLAAGASARFGADDKLLADLGGRPLLDHAARVGLTVPAAQHVFVARPAFPGHATPSGYVRLDNARAGEGLGASLRLAALHAMAAGGEALLVLLADMPLVSAAHLAALLAMAGDDRPVMTRRPDGNGDGDGDGGGGQPPALFPAALLPALAALGGDKGARDMAGKPRLIAAAPETLLDVDTPDDLARARGLLGL
jgi:molybdenum cofactor cytidylyltransferase